LPYFPPANEKAPFLTGLPETRQESKRAEEIVSELEILRSGAARLRRQRIQILDLWRPFRAADAPGF
jgi:hypothetical protein